MASLEAYYESCRFQEEERQIDRSLKYKIYPRTRVHFTKFLKVMLQLCAKDCTTDADALLENALAATMKVYNSDEFAEGRKTLEAYCAPRSKKKERKGHHQLARCFNKAFELLTREEIPDLKELSEFNDIVFHVNNKNPICHQYGKGKKSHLSPDICLVTQRLLDVKRNVNNKSAVQLEWSEILCTAEVRLMGEKGFSTPHQEYTSLHSRNVKNYFALRSMEVWRRNKCASKCFQDTDAETNVSLSREYSSSDSNSVIDYFSSSDHAENFDEKFYANVDEKLYGPSEILAPPVDNGCANDTNRKRKADSPPQTSSQSRPKKRPNMQSSQDRNLHLDAETNQPETEKKTEVKTHELSPNSQMVSFGREILSRGVYALHSINILIVDDIIWIWWYDRANVIQTAGLNFVEDMPYFMVLLAAFQRFGLPEWGVEPSLAPASIFIKPMDPHLQSIDVKFDNGVVANFDLPPSSESHFRRRPSSLNSRATCIVSATSPSTPPNSPKSLEGEDLIIKACWPELQRHNEVKIIQRAVDAVESSDDDKYLAKNLPKLYGWKDLPSSVTNKIMDLLGRSMENTPRVLRLLLFRRLEPIQDIEDEDKLLAIWMQCFKCHYALWNHGIEHGDISVWNLMWDPVDKCAVLNDFDLSEIRGSENFGHRAHTLPFMARQTMSDEFIKGDEQRRYIDEVECFSWVLAWLGLRGTELPKWREWRTAGCLTSSLSAKYSFTRLRPGDKPIVCKYKNIFEKSRLLLRLIDRMKRLEDDWEYDELPGKCLKEYNIHSQAVKVFEAEYGNTDVIHFYKAMLSVILQIHHVLESRYFKDV